MKRLLVRERYFYWEDGEPFFYLGDTAWELLHQLNREEIARYMALRAQQGFTVVQTVALAELDACACRTRMAGNRSWTGKTGSRIRPSPMWRAITAIGITWITRWKRRRNTAW